jgi:hypothetical protein
LRRQDRVCRLAKRALQKAGRELPTHFGPLFLEDNYVLFEVDRTNWAGDVGQGSCSYLCYWEGLPYRSRLLVRVPAAEAHHFTGTGGFSPAE